MFDMSGHSIFLKSNIPAVQPDVCAVRLQQKCITQYLSTPILATGFLHDYYISWKHMEKDVNKQSWEVKKTLVGWKLNCLYFFFFSPKFLVAKHPVNCYVSTHLFHWRHGSRPLKQYWQNYLVTGWSSSPDGEEYVQMSVKYWTRPTDIFSHSSIQSQFSVIVKAHLTKCFSES